MHQHFLWANLHEIRLFSIPMLQDIRGLPAAGFFQMPLQQRFQLRHPMLHSHGSPHQRFGVQHFIGLAIRVIQISHAAGHARAKVRTDRSKDHSNTAGHVFTAV